MDIHLIIIGECNMKKIRGEERLTKTEALQAILDLAHDLGENESTDTSGMSYRKGTTGNTVAVSYCLPVYRKGIAYYKSIRYGN
jgi:hypothetical protein